MKKVRFVGSSRKDLKGFPAPVRRRIGQSLFEAQNGRMPISAKVLKGFQGAGLIELIEDFYSDAYRAIYTVRFEDFIYVLHAFMKKSKSGIKTPKKEMDLINSRLKEIQNEIKKIR